MFIHAYLLLNASIAHKICIYGRGSNKLFASTNIAKSIGYSVGFTPKLFCCSLQNFSYEAFHYNTTNQCNHYVIELFDIKICYAKQKLKSIKKTIIKIGQAVSEISLFVFWPSLGGALNLLNVVFYFTGIFWGRKVVKVSILSFLGVQNSKIALVLT